MKRLTEIRSGIPCIVLQQNTTDTWMLTEGKWKGSQAKFLYGEHAKVLRDVQDILGDDYDLDRLRELVQADREGRCGIPPVKLHQTIYRVFDGKILEEKVCKAVWEPFMPRPRWKVWVMGSGLPYYWDDCVGKTVFLTREAAKAAMEGEQA